MHKLDNLNIWKKSIDLTTRVYKITALLPEEEKYGLSSQLKRAATSVASNIAEGAGRNSKKEFKQFLSIANGSAYELQTQLVIIEKLKLVDSKKTKPINDLVIEIQKMNYNLQNKL